MGRFYNFLSIKVKIIVSTWTYLSNAIAIVINIEAVNANCVKGYRRCGKSTVCISVAMSNTSPFLKLSRMEPNKYRESKQAITTSRRLNAFLISFLVQRIYEAKKFPTIPRMATIHWATPSIKKDTVSSNSFSSSIPHFSLCIAGSESHVSFSCECARQCSWCILISPLSPRINNIYSISATCSSPQ